MQGDEASSLAFPSPGRDPSIPALHVDTILFLKALEGQRGYIAQLQQHMSLIYKERPSVKEQPCKRPGN